MLHEADLKVKVSKYEFLKAKSNFWNMKWMANEFTLKLIK